MIKNELFRKIIGIDNYLEKIKSYDYFNSTSYVAIENYKIFISFLNDNYKEIDESTYQTLYSIINVELIPTLRYIERSSTPNVPWSLIPNLDKILKNEFGEDYLLLFRPQWRFNYSVITNDVIEFLESILVMIFPQKKDKIDKIFTQKKIHIFSFPYFEKTNVLLNSIIGHEIGHFYHNKWKTSNNADAIFQKAEFVLAEFYRKKFPKDMFASYEKTDEGIKIIKGMYREILSDIFGYMIFGPSIVFSLYYISSLEDKLFLPSQDTNYYPLLKYRIRILFENFVKIDKNINDLLSVDSECSSYLKIFLQEIDNYLSEQNDLILLKNIEQEIKLFEESIPHLIKYSKAEISQMYFNTELTSKLFDKLDDHFPINELDGLPINMSSIIFVGWIYYFKISRESDYKAFVLNYQILMRLLLKSLFSSHVHNEYVNTLTKH